MRWTMISIGLMGLITYGMIFLAQVQHDPKHDPKVVAPVESTPIEVSADAFATLDQPEVSDPKTTAPEPELPQWEGDSWSVGVAAFEARDDGLAVDALRAAVAEREDSSYRHYLLGLALRRTGAIEDAVTELERSLELGPAAPKSWVALARCELDRGESAAARTAVDTALELDLDSADAWQVLGRVELSEGSAEQAEAAFSKALQRDPDLAWAANNLGYTRILQERFEDALAPLQDAVASGVDEPVFFNNLGTALERTGHEELAAYAYAHAVIRGHGPAEASMERIESRLATPGTAFAAVDSVEFIGVPELAARVEQAILLVAVEGDDGTTTLEPELAATDQVTGHE